MRTDMVPAIRRKMNNDFTDFNRDYTDEKQCFVVDVICF